MYVRLKPDFIARKAALSGLIALPNAKKFKQPRQQSMSELHVLKTGLSGRRAARPKTIQVIRQTLGSFECLSCKDLSTSAALDKFRQEASKSRGFPS
jgi:hypothetical protein